MSHYTLYKEIKDPLRVIEKIVMEDEGGGIDYEWRNIRWQIEELARQCKDIVKERKERDREEATERRAMAKEAKPAVA